MGRWSVYLVLGLILGAALVTFITLDPGYILIAWGEWQVETSVWLAMALLLTALMVFSLLLSVMRSTLRIPRSLKRWLGLRATLGAQRRTDKGLAAFFEGRWNAAERALRKGGHGDDRSPLHWLYAAIAAHRSGDRARAETLLAQAEEEGEVPLSLIAMVRAECYLEMGDTDAARRAVEHLEASARTTPRFKKLQAELAYTQQRWTDLIASIPALRDLKIVSAATLDQWEREGWRAAMAADQTAAERLALWRKAPAAQKQAGSPLWETLVAQLKESRDEEVLLKALLERLESHREDVSLDAVLVLPGRLAGKLKKVVSALATSDADAQCLAALAHIAEHQGEDEVAGSLWRRAYAASRETRHGLRLSSWLRANSEPDLAAEVEAELLDRLHH